MKRRALLNLTLSLATVACVGAPASAQWMQLNYSSLASSYSGGNFVARAVDVPQSLRSEGFVDRLVLPTGTRAEFKPGFTSDPNPADFYLTLTVTPAGLNLYEAAGTFVSMDVTGDSLTGVVTGYFHTGGPEVVFSGSAFNIAMLDDSSDGTFDGDSGFFERVSDSPMTGVLTLSFPSPSGSVFDGEFLDRATGLSASVVPAPAGATLLALAAGLAARRRR